MTVNIYSFYSSENEISRLRERFKKQTKRDLDTGCLIWNAGKDQKGYGRLWIGFTRTKTLKKEFAHRVAWMLEGRSISAELPFILHNCPAGDNPLCCEISHLWAGTCCDNNRDRSKKDRSRRSKRGLPRGVQPNRGLGSFQARVQIGSTQKYLGSFPTVEEAFAVASAAQKIVDSGGSI